MARFSMDEVEHYGGQGGSGFFRLVNDKDTALVRFLYTGIDDVEGYAVHQVVTGTRDDGSQIKQYVNCLRSYNEPKENCPFCASGMSQQAKLFIPLYNIDKDKIEIWDRGKKFFAKISGICSHYANVVSHTFLIERHGEKGATTTTYEIYPEEKDDTTIDQFEVPEILGGTVLDKTAEDMEYYLEAGQFPPVDDEEVPVSRSASRRTNSQEAGTARRTGRRTPANRESF